MRYILLFLFLSLTAVQAQDYARVDARVKQYPKQYASAEALARQIQKDFSLDTEKVRALYTWLATNITYDMNEYLNGERLVRFQYRNQTELLEKQNAIREYAINSTLSDNKAVCEGFAQTFKKVCELMGIRCLFIEGYSKVGTNDIDKNPERGDHAWNAVKINNKWKLIDVTWASGSANGSTWRQNFNDYYFFTDADEFVKTHLPSTRGLSFATEEPAKKEFFNAPVYEIGYFQNKLKLLSPLRGELSVKQNHTITFEFGTIPEQTTLYYAFKEDSVTKKITPNCTANKCTFNVYYTKSRASELIIFVNKKMALSYKIKLKK